MKTNLTVRLALASLWLLIAFGSAAQVPPTTTQKAAYGALHAAPAAADAKRIRDFVANGAPVDTRDDYFRTPLHVAAYGRHHDAMRALVAAGANPNALERDRYDIVTIASVADDVPTRW